MFKNLKFLFYLTIINIQEERKKWKIFKVTYLTRNRTECCTLLLLFRNYKKKTEFDFVKIGCVDNPYFSVVILYVLENYRVSRIRIRVLIRFRQIFFAFLFTSDLMFIAFWDNRKRPNRWFFFRIRQTFHTVGYWRNIKMSLELSLFFFRNQAHVTQNTWLAYTDGG